MGVHPGCHGGGGGCAPRQVGGACLMRLVGGGRWVCTQAGGGGGGCAPRQVGGAYLMRLVGGGGVDVHPGRWGVHTS